MKHETHEPRNPRHGGRGTETMATQWTQVTRDDRSALPTMLVQAIIVASVLCIGELVCAPIYVGMSHNVVALVPWALSACLFAVAFTYTVGFALLWAVESLADRMNARLRPVAYAVAGLVGFGAWSAYVVTSFLNSILQPLGFDKLAASEQVSIAVNGAALGMAAFFLASAFGATFASKRVGVIIAGVATLAAAGLGAFYVMAMYSRLY